MHDNAGVFIHACNASGRHVIALEPDTEISEALLKPLQDLPKLYPVVNAPSSVEGDNAFGNKDLILPNSLDFVRELDFLFLNPSFCPLYCLF